jgi:hypothetical protein
VATAVIAGIGIAIAVSLALVVERRARKGNAPARGAAAFVVDDTVPEDSGPFRAGVGRGIEVRGSAEALVGVAPPARGGDLFSHEVVRIHPDQIISWHIDPARADLSVLKGNETRHRTQEH